MNGEEMTRVRATEGPAPARPENPPPSAFAARRRTGLASLGFGRALSIGAIVLALGVVTVPRLQTFAMRENEADARSIVQVLAQVVADQDGAVGPIGALPLDEGNLRHRFRDAVPFEDGRSLRMHGYLFDLVRGTGVVRAWPWRHERTGRAAYVFTEDGRLLRHPNASGEFAGPQGAPAGPWTPELGWTSLVADGDYR